jgi:hypothetical protein
MLYRPFLHYMTSSADEQPDSTQVYASLCIRACLQIVHLNAELLDSDLTPNVNWTTAHPMMTSLFTLLYVVLECPDDERASTTIEELALGRKVLGVLARYDYGAYRCKTVLTVLRTHGKTGMEITDTFEVLIARLPNQFKYIRERLQAFEDNPRKLVQTRKSGIVEEPLSNFKFSSMGSFNTSSSEADSSQSNPAYRDLPPGQQHPVFNRYTVVNFAATTGQSAPPPQMNYSMNQPGPYASSDCTDVQIMTQSDNSALASHFEYSINSTTNGYIEAQPFSLMPNRAVNQFGGNAIHGNIGPDGLGSENLSVQDIFSLVDIDGYEDGIFGYD